MIDTSTQTPTLAAIFKCLDLHNVWCLHQHKPNSGASTEAVLGGQGKSLGKGEERMDPPSPGPELGSVIYLSVIYSWLGWAESVSAPSLGRAVIPSSCSLCLSHSFRSELTEKKNLF